MTTKQIDVLALKDYLEAETHYLLDCAGVEEELARTRRRLDRQQRPDNLIDRAIRSYLGSVESA